MALPPAPPPPHESHDTTLTLGLPYSLVSPSLGEGFGVVRSSSLTGDASPCTECGKRFPSLKALFGHMRCHPERPWRGITPPPRFLHGGAGRFTVQEREVATTLLMLSAASPAGTGKGKGKKSIAAASPSPSTLEICGTSASAAPDLPANCDHGHKCSVCNRGFASGQALGGHRRCHLVRDAVVIAAAGSSGSGMSKAAVATVLDLNLPPPGTPLILKSDVQGSSMHEMLDLKLGYV